MGNGLLTRRTYDEASGLLLLAQAPTFTELWSKPQQSARGPHDRPQQE